jgi:hypothetical protein
MMPVSQKRFVVALFAFGACTVQRAEPVRVTREAIGSMRIDRPLGELRGMMRNATDTTVTIGRTTGPGIVFRFPDLTVVATQQRDSLDPSRPADMWTLTGCGGQLPNAVPLCANWQELTRAFGRTGTGTTATGPAIVRLCSLPGFEFELDVGQGTVGSLETAPDLSSVPGTARIERVTLSRTTTDSCEPPAR